MTKKPKITLLFDTETTGIPRYPLPADHPEQPYMAQLAMVLVEQPEPLTFNVLERYVAMVTPEGWTMPDEVARIHGLSTEKLLAEGRPVREVLDRFNEFYDRCDEYLSYGIIFDTKIMRGALRRNGYPDRFGEKAEGCVMRAATEPCRMAPTANMMAAGRRGPKTPKLIEAHEILLGRKFERAHDAAADTDALVSVWQHLLMKGLMPETKRRESLPEDQRPIAVRQAKAATMLDKPAAAGDEISAL